MDPMRELFWSAVLNGVIAMPIMALMMLLASDRRVMGAHVIGPRLRALGWLATAAMVAVVLALWLSAGG
jgi:Mn2+/Fe2+ NRAMP family transporter